MPDMRVFVVGCPRSGTTLVQSILAASPEVFSLPETHFFDTLYSGGARLLAPFWAERRLRLLIRINPELDPYPSGTVIRMRRAVNRFVGWMDRQTDAQGCRVWVEKTPFHLRVIDKILWHPLLNQAIFVHVLRDMKSNVGSLMRVGPVWGWPRSEKEAIFAWLDSLGRSFSYMDEPRHHFVFYSDLVSRPAETVADLYRFLGLEPNMNWQSEFHAVASRLVGAEELEWKGRNVAKPVISRGLGDAGLSDGVREMIERARVVLSRLAEGD